MVDEEYGDFEHSCHRVLRAGQRIQSLGTARVSPITNVAIWDDGQARASRFTDLPTFRNWHYCD
jgi:hypothetical protein